MRRLGIFSFYDKDGIVDSYVEYLLNDLCDNLERLIIVVNGTIGLQSREILTKFASEIIIRNNEGYDIGAYLDVIFNYLKKDELKDWDELVLCNDTFFGPFVSFGDIFHKMQGSDVDFWGMNYVDGVIFSHIQSYFLVFRKNILRDGALYTYGEMNIDLLHSKVFQEIFVRFEVGLYSYLTNLEYKGGTYTNTENYSIYSSPYICMERYKLPILKKKAFASVNISACRHVDAIRFINSQTMYSVDCVLRSVERLYGVKFVEETFQNDEVCDISMNSRKVIMPQTTELEIQKFINKNSNICIYGAGILAKKIWFYCGKSIKNFNGFIVSDGETIKDKELFGYPVYHFCDRKEGGAMIVALNLENTKKVKDIIHPTEETLYLWKSLEIEK